MQTALQQQPNVADLQAAANAANASAATNGANGSSLSSTSSPSSPSSSVLELRCLLDNASVGGIIGRGGACVREVREQSGAVLSIVKADTRHAAERIMILKGHAQQIAVAAKCCAQLYEHKQTDTRGERCHVMRTERSQLQADTETVSTRPSPLKLKFPCAEQHTHGPNASFTHMSALAVAVWFAWRVCVRFAVRGSACWRLRRGARSIRSRRPRCACSSTRPASERSSAARGRQSRWGHTKQPEWHINAR